MFAEAFRDQQPMQEATLIRMSSSSGPASSNSTGIARYPGEGRGQRCVPDDEPPGLPGGHRPNIGRADGRHPPAAVVARLLPTASGRSSGHGPWDGDLAFAQRDGHPIGLRIDIEAGAEVADARGLHGRHPGPTCHTAQFRPGTPVPRGPASWGLGRGRGVGTPLLFSFDSRPEYRIMPRSHCQPGGTP